MLKIDKSLYQIFLRNDISRFDLSINIIIGLCVAALFTAILINFVSANDNTKVKNEKKSIVETGTMTMFFVFFYFLLRLRIGVINAVEFKTHVILAVIGTAIVVVGCYVNILGRLALGKNWGNQIRIYQDHTLVQKGMYKVVRHPLYASIIWMFYGASLVYMNYSAFLANTFIFIPFMYYRAKQEENLLVKQYTQYEIYQKTTGMFFPKIFRRGNDEGL